MENYKKQQEFGEKKDDIQIDSRRTLEGEEMLSFLEAHQNDIADDAIGLFSGNRLKPNSRLIVMEGKGKLIGLATVSPGHGTTCSFDAMYVPPEFRGRDIGRELFMEQLRVSDEMKAGDIYIDILSPAVAKIVSELPPGLRRFFIISGDPEILSRFNLIEIDEEAKAYYERVSEQWVERPVCDKMDLACVKRFLEQVYEGKFGDGKLVIDTDTNQIVRLLPMKLSNPRFTRNEEGLVPDQLWAQNTNIVWTTQAIIPSKYRIGWSSYTPTLAPLPGDLDISTTNEIDKRNEWIRFAWANFLQVKTGEISSDEFRELFTNTVLKGNISLASVWRLFPDVTRMIPSETLLHLRGSGDADAYIFSAKGKLVLLSEITTPFAGRGFTSYELIGIIADLKQLDLLEVSGKHESVNCPGINKTLTDVEMESIIPLLPGRFRKQVSDDYEYEKKHR